MSRKSWKERRRRLKQTAGIGELVDTVLDTYRLSDELRACRVQLEWRRIVGPRLAARTWPGLVRDGVLPVRVLNSSWLHELSFLRGDLVERVNRCLGDPPLVQEIRLHLGRRGKGQGDVHVSVQPRRPGPPRRPLPPPATGRRLAEIEAETAEIEDPELREIITEARRRLDC